MTVVAVVTATSASFKRFATQYKGKIQSGYAGLGNTAADVVGTLKLVYSQAESQQCFTKKQNEIKQWRPMASSLHFYRAQCCIT